MHPFFNRPPEQVARDLTGLVLITNKKVSIITHLVARDAAHCHRFRNRAICSPEKEVDVAVELYLGKPVLFIRTQAAETCWTCVQVDEIERIGRVVTGPAKVCEDLGIPATPATGKLSFDGTVLVIDWD